MSWKTYRVINNIYYVNKINKVLFMQLNDTIYDYDDTLELQFNKYKQDGNIDVYNGVVSIGNTSQKIMIEINIFYKYYNG